MPLDVLDAIKSVNPHQGDAAGQSLEELTATWPFDDLDRPPGRFRKARHRMGLAVAASGVVGLAVVVAPLSPSGSLSPQEAIAATVDALGGRKILHWELTQSSTDKSSTTRIAYVSDPNTGATARVDRAVGENAAPPVRTWYARDKAWAEEVAPSNERKGVIAQFSNYDASVGTSVTDNPVAEAESVLRKAASTPDRVEERTVAGVRAFVVVASSGPGISTELAVAAEGPARILSITTKFACPSEAPCDPTLGDGRSGPTRTISQQTTRWELVDATPEEIGRTEVPRSTRYEIQPAGK